ncbi:MAG TPA: ACP phosphodiesterase [Chitinophagaceae bacterium]|nr:ACP phosphodiesterase [Chitinophagaceae bacterium]
MQPFFDADNGTGFCGKSTNLKRHYYVMNYLAHAYLSFGDPEILAGNIFSDFVKGKKKFDFPKRIQQGIALHRAIDQFTDDHEATIRAKQFFRPAYGLYAAAFVDVAFDHFLAADRTVFAEGELKEFTGTTYTQLKESVALFPEKFRVMFHYMELQDWLYNYQFTEGIFRSFGGLVRRAAYMDDPQPACDTFLRHYEVLNGCYSDFFPELRSFALHKFEQMD